MGFLSKLFDNNAREIARYRKTVERINALEPTMAKLADDQLAQKTEELRTRIQTEYRKQIAVAEPTWEGLTDQQKREADRKIYDPILDAALPEAFALVREAAKRAIGLRHYDVQLIGGMALHDGRIAEMRTGEGKTLVGTCPIFLNALLGKGAHLVTVNDYLSKRDAVWNGPIYHLLGLSVGIIQGQSPETGDEGGSFLYDPTYEDPDPRYTNARPITRAEAYACDITYGTNNEFGFDYLRDNMAFSKDELSQGYLHYAIVDEVDSILIDEARTPLIISGMAEKSTDNYRVVNEVVAKMQRGIDDPKRDKDNPNADKLKPNIHYVVDEKAKTATITDAGVAFVERELGIDNISDNHEIMHYLSAAMKAHGVFRKDIDYVVKDAGEGPEIIIVDENTGRLMFGRRYSDGLHQSIEAKEYVEVKNESQTLATITFQNYFRLYSKLSGMTGTAKTEEDEFRKIYALDVVTVPTNKDIQRKDQPDMIFKREEHKIRNIAGEILRVYCKQQPVLVGTRSIEMSERVSKRVSPHYLKLLTLIEIAREKLEADRALPKDKKAQFTEILNYPMEPFAIVDESGKRTQYPPLSMTQVRPILKELGLSDDPLSPANMNASAKIFQIEDSGLEHLEEALSHGIPHNILNAKFHEQEAIIIAEAGRKGAVTIATNMAGRGVDILLGGKHINQELPPVAGDKGSLEIAADALEDDENAPESDVENVNYRRFGNPSVLRAVTTGGLTDEEHRRAGEEVRALGGLYILGTERHESRRIDNQLRGRAGRQGDPGESRFFVSLEDELMRLFGDRTNHAFLKTWDDHLGMDHPMLSKMIERAQRKIEEHHFESRKHVLNYDDVMNRQRELIYRERRRILEGEDLRETTMSYITDTIDDAIATYCPANQPQKEWEIEELFRDLDEYFTLSPQISVEDLSGKSAREISSYLTDHVIALYEEREKTFEELHGEAGAMREIERFMALRAINKRWMEHLANMDYLREGIHLRGYEQRDPLLIYQKEAFEEFERMQAAIQDDIIRDIFRVQLVPDMPEQEFDTPLILPLPELPAAPPTVIDVNLPEEMRSGVLNGIAPQKREEKAPPGWKGGRNDLCWCGSGQKFKRCHGK